MTSTAPAVTLAAAAEMLAASKVVFAPAMVAMVRANELGTLAAAIEKLAKRAAKLHMAAPVLRVRAEFDVLLTDGFGLGAIERRRACAIVSLDGQAPVVAGWEVVAVIEHIEGETLIHPLVEGVDVSQYRGASAARGCDHCGLVRSRTSTYVLRNETGAMKRVGKSCLVDFAGSAEYASQLVACAEMALLYGAALASVSGMGDDDFEGGRGGPVTYGLASFIAWCVASVLQFGWTSKSKCTDAQIPTAVRVCGTLDGTLRTAGARVSAPSAVEMARAEVVIAAVLASTEDSEFMANLRAIARMGVVSERHTGIAAAMVMVVDRMDRDAERRAAAAATPSAFVGTVGERSVMTLTVVRHKRLADGDFGPTTLLTFVDAAGNDLVWFASGASFDATFPVGGVVTVKATVKRHALDKYSGRNTTTLSRVAVYVAPAPKAKKARKAVNVAAP